MKNVLLVEVQAGIAHPVIYTFGHIMSAFHFVYRRAHVSTPDALLQRSRRSTLLISHMDFEGIRRLLFLTSLLMF